MCSIATDYNGSLEAAHAHIDDNRYDRFLNVVLSASPHLTSSDYLRGHLARSSLTWTSSGQLRGCSIGSTIATRMSSANVLDSIATDYNGPLEAAHKRIDDDRYDMMIIFGSTC